MEFAASAPEALAKAGEIGEATLILILSDVNMPGMSGLELLPKVRLARPDVPVFMITAYGDADTRRRAEAGGASGLFTKPIDFAELKRTIEARLAAVDRAAVMSSRCRTRRRASGTRRGAARADGDRRNLEDDQPLDIRFAGGVRYPDRRGRRFDRGNARDDLH